MKKITALILVALFAMITLIAIHSISSNYMAELDKKDSEIACLKSQIDNSSIHYPVSHKNDYWQLASGNALYGTIYFDNLNDVREIFVTYLNSDKDKYTIYDHNVYYDYAENTVLVYCCYGWQEITPDFCELEIYYSDGSSSTILIDIVMG